MHTATDMRIRNIAFICLLMIAAARGLTLAAANSICTPANSICAPADTIITTSGDTIITLSADSVSICDNGSSLCVADTAVADTAVVDTLEAPWPQNIVDRIEDLLTHGMFETTMAGIMVYDLTADSVLFTHNHRQRLRPASTMKLVTAITALDRLGGSHLFKTSLMYKGEVADSTLTGDLYCVGGFDPRFNVDDLHAFVESIRVMGIDTIRGRIVIDKTMKDSDTLGWGWCWDDDNPILSPLLLSRKDDFKEHFLQALSDEGIILEVTCSEGRVPADAETICIRTHSIDQILMKMMKDSDNLYAESMYYQVAASVGARPAKAAHARQVISKLVSKTGLNPKTYVFADGSGLSLYNYVTAEMEVALLKYAYRNSNIYIHLFPSLPIAGVDGTLKKRMRGTAAEGNVHAKTGTVEGVSALAGYCTAANGHVLCFSIINQGIIYSSTGRNFQNRVCDALCR